MTALSLWQTIHITFQLYAEGDKQANGNANAGEWIARRRPRITILDRSNFALNEMAGRAAHICIRENKYVL